MFNETSFKTCIVAAGKTAKDMAVVLGINKSTLYRKIANNGAFTREEIQTMKDYLHIENAHEIFFAD